MLNRPHRPMPFALGRKAFLPKVRSAASPNLGVTPPRESGYNARAFVAGGQDVTAGPTFTTSAAIDKFTKAFETYGRISSTLPAVRPHGGCGLNSVANGFIAGGSNPGSLSVASILRFSFMLETNVTSGGTLPTAKQEVQNCAISDLYTKGFVVGGLNLTPVETNTITRLSYATESAVDIVATLSSARGHIGGVNNSAVGYAMGGNPGPSIVIDKLTMIEEVVSTIAATLDAAAFASACVSGPLKGYKMGGAASPSPVASIEDMHYAAETSSTISAVLDQGNQSAGGSAFLDRAYKFTGLAPSGLPSSTIRNLIWYIETSATIAQTITPQRVDFASIHTSGMP